MLVVERPLHVKPKIRQVKARRLGMPLADTNPKRKADGVVDVIRFDG